MNREIPLTLTTDQITYVLELLNNERFDRNPSLRLAERIITRLAAQEAAALASFDEEDAYWSAREANLNDEHIEAACAARALGY